MVKTTAQEILAKEIPPKNSKKKVAWLLDHKDEINLFLRGSTLRKTVTYYHTDSRTLRNYHIIPDVVSKDRKKMVLTKRKESRAKRVFGREERANIQSDLDNLPLSEVRRKYRVGSSTLELEGFTWKKKLGKKASVPPVPQKYTKESAREEKLLEFLETLSEILNSMRRSIQQSVDIETLKNQVAELQKKTEGLKAQLPGYQQSCNVERIDRLEKYIQVIIACFTEALNDLGLRKEIHLELKLPDLQHFKGVGSDGKRASFQPEHCYSINITRVKRQK